MFDLLTDMQATFTRLETLRIPVIAAIQGGCIGGAVDMVTACCIRYATADAFFCIQEINIGMVADVGTLQRLPKLIPLGVVKELAYTGRRLPAAKALGYGLVNEVFDSQEVDAGRGPAVRAGDRRKAAGGDLGHQAGHPLRTRPFGGGCAAADGLGAGRDLEQRACARGGDGDEAETRRDFPDLPKLGSFRDLGVKPALPACTVTGARCERSAARPSGGWCGRD